MSPKKTLAWLVLAGGLFAFIFFFHRHSQTSSATPLRVLPSLKPEAVTSVLVRPSSQLQIRADRTNGTWELAQPLAFPAQPARIHGLLAFLAQLKPASYITGSELRNLPHADEEYGFASPQATLVLQQGDYVPRILIGSRTVPGDQVFLQVEGDLGAYVVDAQLLRYLPASADDWRDTTLLSVAGLAFDRVTVTNNAKGDSGRAGLPSSSATFVLQREPAGQLWRMVWPLEARANNSRIQAALQKLGDLRIRRFVSDDPKPDLESVGLDPAELQLGFANGTNALKLLQFGRSPTNDLTLILAREPGKTGIVTVDKQLLLDWCAALNDFRDPHLLSLTDAVDTIEITTKGETFSIRLQAGDSWHVVPGNLPADADSVHSFLSGLTNVQILKFVNDVVNPADLPEYGLAPPLYHLSLRGRCATTGGATNTPILAELDFGLGTNAPDLVFAKRNDESSVYAISTNDFAQFPSAGWQLRDRKLCQMSLPDITGLTLRQRGKVCRMIHKGPLSWSFAPGSQGIINDAAIEETVRGVIQIAAIRWVGRGAQSRAAFGFADDGYHLVLELKSGDNFDLELGGDSPSGNVYAAVLFDGQPWILEFPWILYRDIAAYLPLKPER